MNTNDKKDLSNRIKELTKKREQLLNEYYKILNDPKYKKIIELENKRQKNETELKELDSKLDGKRLTYNTKKKELDKRMDRIIQPNPNKNVTVTIQPNKSEIKNPQIIEVNLASFSSNKNSNANNPINPINSNMFNTTNTNSINPNIIPVNSVSPSNPIQLNISNPYNSSPIQPIDPLTHSQAIRPNNNNFSRINPSQMNQTQSSPINPIHLNTIQVTQNMMNTMNNPITINSVSPNSNPINSNPISINPSVSINPNPINSINPNNPITYSRISSSGVPIPVPMPQPRQPSKIERAIKTFETSFTGTYHFKLIQSLPRANLEMFDSFNFDSHILLLETAEGKMVGIFLGAYFIFVENNSLRYALTSLNESRQPLPIFRPHQCNGDYMVINNSFFLFPEGFQINNIGQDLDLQPGENANEMFTIQQGNTINVVVDQFHIILATPI